jgi:hypothetical protein
LVELESGHGEKQTDSHPWNRHQRYVMHETSNNSVWLVAFWVVELWSLAVTIHKSNNPHDKGKRNSFILCF